MWLVDLLHTNIKEESAYAQLKTSQRKKHAGIGGCLKQAFSSSRDIRKNSTNRQSEYSFSSQKHRYCYRQSI